jgi:hypothetical protein
MSEEGNWRDEAAIELARQYRGELALAKTHEDQERVARAGRLLALERADGILKAAKALGIHLETHPSETPEIAEKAREPNASANMSAREIVLEYLADNPGAKSAELKTVIEEHLGREIHYKTPGMTLYRLTQENKVRREGHRWFAVTDDQQREREQQEQEFDL